MINRHLWKATLGALLGLASCTGVIGREVGGDPEIGAGMTGTGIDSNHAVDGTPPKDLVIGTSILHRLTRAEYTNTVRDLLGTTLSSVAILPSDDGADGFTKASQPQSSSTNTLQGFEEASKNLVESVFGDAALKARLVRCDLSTGNACIRSTLETFLPKAWRRAAQPAEVDRLMALADTEAKAGGSAEEQLKLALRAALTSANFLYLIERDLDPSDTKPHDLSDFELANRLSYFVWSSMPDDALAAAAAQGKLGDDTVIADQVKRMLADPRGSAMTTGFAAEWVQLATIPTHTVDDVMFPMVDDALKSSMVQQTTTFFQDLLNGGGPLRDLIAADYTFVDAGLAKLYGLSAPKGSGFVKTSLTGTTRIGGLLGQSSILMQFASTQKTSPVKRGAWVLDQVLCAPSPPPPADVAAANNAQAMDPAFQAKVATETWRERLAEHRAPAKCAVCHNRIDPIGLGLENYDAVGQYRTMDVGKLIDASGQLDPTNDGTKFTDARGMVGLLSNDDRVASCVGEKLLTFALARHPTDSEVEQMKSRISGNGDSLLNLITKVATSTPFRMRSGAGL
jgi:hypothetical protein